MYAKCLMSVADPYIAAKLEAPEFTVYCAPWIVASANVGELVVASS